MMSRLMMAAAILTLCIPVFGQDVARAPALGYADSFQLDYLDIFGSVYFTNAGVHSNPQFPTTSSDICVNAYVYYVDGSLFSCCSCRVAPNATQTIQQLPEQATGATDAVTVKLVASLPRRNVPVACDPLALPNAGALGVSGGFAAGMRAWSISLPVGTIRTTFLTTRDFSKVPLGDGEEAKLATQCSQIARRCTCGLPQ